MIRQLAQSAMTRKPKRPLPKLYDFSLGGIAGALCSSTAMLTTAAAYNYGLTPEQVARSSKVAWILAPMGLDYAYVASELFEHL